LKEYKARDKIVQKMSRDGLTEENKATGEVKNISTKEAELSFGKKAKADAPKQNSRPHRRQKPPDSILQGQQPAPDMTKPTGGAATTTPQQPGQAVIGKVAEKSPLPIAPDNPAQKDTGAVERVIDRVDTEHSRRVNKRTIKRANEEIRKQGQRPSRLEFSEAERSDPALDKAIRKSDKAADKLDKAQAKIPKKKRISAARTFDEATGRSKVRLHFEETGKQPNGKMKHNPLDRPLREIGVAAHGKIHQVEKDNSGVEGAHKAEQLGERAGRKVKDGYRSHKLKPYRAAAKAETKLFKVNANARYQQALRDNPQLAGANPLAKAWQKRKIKRDYAKELRKGTVKGAQKTAATAKKTAQKAAEATQKTAAFVVRHWKTIGIIVAAILILVLLFAGLSSCGSMLQGGFTGVVGTSYTAEDEDILQVEADYTALETGLRNQINRIESDYPNYDEYRYTLDEIGHDPFELASYLTAKYNSYTPEQVQAELQAIFGQQYTLTLTKTTETRTETKVIAVGEAIGQVRTTAYCACSICCGPYANGITASGTQATANRTIAVDAYNPIVPIGTKVVISGVTYTVEDTGNLNANGADIDIYFATHAEALAWGRQTHTAYLAGGNSNTVAVTVTKTVRILNVTLKNHAISSVAAVNLNAEQWEMYNIYMETKGNKDYLFEGNIYIDRGEYTDYNIPGDALTDANFAALIREAEKYLGYPYVWGGSSPSTSFDCSGFVCYVLNKSGVASVGRTTANGLFNLCDIIPASEAKPGDLIFFQGTYDTAGASHVGIYVGNNMMLHCGNPIQYTSINTTYWQSHFYAFGRY